MNSCPNLHHSPSGSNQTIWGHIETRNWLRQQLKTWGETLSWLVPELKAKLIRSLRVWHNGVAALSSIRKRSYRVGAVRSLRLDCGTSFLYFLRTDALLRLVASSAIRRTFPN